MKAKKQGKVKVDAPKGYHWMSERGRYFLMAHEGDFVAHKGASLSVDFKVISKHNS
tara:strand:- start:1018 stop:1185 length:168 start_codon:yes stop_codon:yes gene_type:complete